MPFDLEAREQAHTVHAALDHLDRDPAVDRFVLLGQQDLAHAALAQHAEHAEGTDLRRRCDVASDGGLTGRRRQQRRQRLGPIRVPGRQVAHCGDALRRGEIEGGPQSGLEGIAARRLVHPPIVGRRRASGKARRA